jgi:Phosphotransferase enzyme family
MPNIGGPFSSASDYYNSWAIEQLSKGFARPGFPLQIQEWHRHLSNHGRGPFRLIHPDFGLNNFLRDDWYNILSVIDWEFTFTGPAEMFDPLPKRLTAWPDNLDVFGRDQYGTFIDRRMRRVEEDKKYLISLVRSIESAGFYPLPRLSENQSPQQERVIFLIDMFERGKKWVYDHNATNPEIKTEVDQKIDDIFQQFKGWRAIYPAEAYSSDASTDVEDDSEEFQF